MNASDAVSLIANAMPKAGAASWADFGAGDGTFTRALLELLGPNSRVYAVDRDAASLAEIERWPRSARANVIPIVADFGRLSTLPGIGDRSLDGALFANALHFIREQETVLAKLVSLMKPAGRVIFVEYDQRGPSPWVPYPIPSARLPVLAESAGLTGCVITARRRSAYGGELYVAAADVPQSPG